MSARALWSSLLMVVVVLAACGGDDAGGGSAAGSAGATSGGSAGATSGGSAGATSGGSAGATSGGSAGATSGGSAGATSGGSAGATSGGSAGQAGKAGGAQAPLPLCVQSCASPADCATPGAPILSASHYSCDGGLCAWKGCATDAECQQTFQKSGYACDKSTALPTCVPTCSAPADCATPGVAIYAADHYACTSGRCEWKGCKGDGECQAALQKPSAVCAKLAGATVATCVPGCAQAADCATPGVAIYAADHYACTSGRCEWKGCKGDGECQQAFMKSGYVCR